ncbi:16S rRNA (cytosine(1402)-N(4))-methyltransferase RsmH, partial [Patescibacteria group bacterium]|nr:16S rRNA (cytosine(1402)-N(4))-methyltransferase RsmH [Patescibacteria group bacterium]
MTFHVPVLLSEVLEYLDPKPGEDFVDCNLGGGGHAKEILAKTGPGGRLLGFDLDEDAHTQATKTLASYKNRITLVQKNFSELKEVAQDNGFKTVDGILFDLGLSTYQLTDSERGFTFSGSENLDMRFSQDQKKTAADLLNHSSKDELVKILSRYGEVRNSKTLAQAIVKYRQKNPFKKNDDLVWVAKGLWPQHLKKTEKRYLAQVFQAFRIAVNNELQSLEQSLKAALEILKPQGRLVVISYHSLEDRIVKRFFKKESQDCHCPAESPLCVCEHQSQFKIMTR